MKGKRRKGNALGTIIMLAIAIALFAPMAVAIVRWLCGMNPYF